MCEKIRKATESMSAALKFCEKTVEKESNEEKIKRLILKAMMRY